MTCAAYNTSFIINGEWVPCGKELNSIQWIFSLAYAVHNTSFCYFVLILILALAMHYADTRCQCHNIQGLFTVKVIKFQGDILVHCASWIKRALWCMTMGDTYFVFKKHSQIVVTMGTNYIIFGHTRFTNEIEMLFSKVIHPGWWICDFKSNWLIYAAVKNSRQIYCIIIIGFSLKLGVLRYTEQMNIITFDHWKNEWLQ